MAARSAVMVGRDTEVSSLLGALSRAEVGEAQLALVRGEAGIGKTRLVRELVARVPNDTVVAFGHAVPLSGGSLPYGVVADLLRGLVREVHAQTVADVLGDRTHALAPLVPQLAGGPAAPVDRLALYAASQDLLVELAADRLLVLVVEDAHWADESSLDLLTFWGRTLVRGRLLLVVTSRDVEVGVDRRALARVGELRRMPHATTVDLHALDAQEVAAQVGALDASLDDQSLRDVQRLSEGIPLFVEELVASARAGVPESLRVDLAAPLRSLPARSRAVLEVAALEPRPFAIDDLAKVAHVSSDVARAVIDEAVLDNILEETRVGRWRFHHELLREAVRTGAPAVTRRAAHLRWATVLSARSERVADLVAAADHQAAAGISAEAFRARVRAAGQVRRVAGDVVESVRQWRLALNLLREDPALATAEQYDDVLAGVVRHAKGEQLREVMERESPGSETGSRVRSAWLTVAGWHQESGPSLAHAIPSVAELGAVCEALSREPSSRLAFEGLSLLHAVMTRIDRPDDEGLERVTDLLDRAASGVAGQEPLALAVAMEARFNLYRAQHRPEEAARIVAQAAEASAGLDVSTRAWISMRAAYLQVEQCRLDAAKNQCEQALSLLPGPEADPRWFTLAGIVIELCLMVGDWDSITPLADRCSSTDAVDFARNRALGAQALIAIWQTDHVDLDALMRPSVESATHGQAASTERYLWDIIGAWHAARTDPRRARRGLIPWLMSEDAEDHVFSFEGFVVAAELAGSQPGDPAFTEVVSAALNSLEQRPYDEAIRALAAPHLDRASGQDTTGSWRAAAEAADGAGLPYYAARLRRQLAEATLASGDRGRAAEALGTALEAAESLAARPLVNEIRLLAGRARLRLPGHETERAEGTGGLTAREFEVLQLLVQGLTNDQIGSALFMSPRTASVHVSRILAKLGATNRTEVAAVAHRRGLVGD